MMNYNEQLKTPEWKSKRLLILKRDGYKCVKCTSKKNLQVHHKKYIPGLKAWQVPDIYLETLCRIHHLSAHYGKKIKIFVLKGVALKIEKKKITQQKRLAQKNSNKNNKYNRKRSKKIISEVIKRIEFKSIKNDGISKS